MSGMRRIGFVAAAWAIVAAVAGGQARAQRSTWPTLHGDNQRSGFTAERLRGPFERKWFRTFAAEMIGARVEAIVAEGKVFVGTYEGNLYALAVADGRTVWTYEAGRPIGHSPCWHDGRLYVGVDDAANAGRLVCLRAADGKEVWTYRTGAGIWNHPATDGRLVYVGNRGGVFHAVDAGTGKAAWTYRTACMILKPASISPSGQHVVFGSEDMSVYCLSPDGKLRWKSPKLPGLSLRDQAPTIWAGRAIVRTNPARAFHESLYEGRRLLAEIQRAIPLAGDDQPIPGTKNNHYMVHTPRREKIENAKVVEFLRAHPLLRTWFTLALADGSEPFVAPVLYTAGMHNPPTPPTFDPRTGALYTILPTNLSPCCDGVSQLGIGIARIDANTGYAHILPHSYGPKVPGWWAGMTMIADETSTLTLMDEFLLASHQGAIGGMDLRTRKFQQLHGVRDTYGGIFGPGSAPGSWDGSKKLAAEGYVQNALNEWHGPDRSAVAIAEGRAFWVVGGQVVCFAGPDVPATDSGGKRPPELFKWKTMPRLSGGNVMGSFGEPDDKLARRALGAKDIEPLLADPPAACKQADGEPARWLRRRLDAAVGELIDGWPWAPLVVELGIAHEEVHFARSAETMQTVALALPHLSPAARAKAAGFLGALLAAGVPLGRPGCDAAGRRREHHTLDPTIIRGAPRSLQADIEDLYALWACAHYAGLWDKLAPQSDAIRTVLSRALQTPYRFDAEANNGYAVADLNRRLAGLIGAVRLARRLHLRDELEGATSALADLASRRAHFERADPRLQSKRSHHASIPRYVALVPETSRLLAEHAAAELAANLDDLRRELHVWYQAWGERLVGGENYTNTPEIARGMFAALADGRKLPAEKLLEYLDQPWCRADLYYIEKLAAALRRLDTHAGG